MNLHAGARTTPSLRREIQQSTLPQPHMLAKKYNVARTTIWKCKHRGSIFDLSHRPHRLMTSLTPAQEQRSGRCTGISNMRKMDNELQKLTGMAPWKKAFKDDEPWYIHIDIKYLPHMAAENKHQNLLRSD